MCPTVANQLKSKPGDGSNLSKDEGAASRRANRVDEFFDERLSAFDCHDLLRLSQLRVRPIAKARGVPAAAPMDSIDKTKDERANGAGTGFDAIECTNCTQP
jgi:hypothetical protein